MWRFPMKRNYRQNTDYKGCPKFYPFIFLPNLYSPTLADSRFISPWYKSIILNFAEYSEDILQRIYRNINLFRDKEPDVLFQNALRTLPAELKQITFDWAVELIRNNGKFSTQNPYLLWNLAQKFGHQKEKEKENISAKLDNV